MRLVVLLPEIQDIYGKGYGQILLVIIHTKNSKQNTSKPTPCMYFFLNVTYEKT